MAKRYKLTGHLTDCGVSITRIKRSQAVTSLIPKTCKAISHTQACYHYYSAFKNYNHIHTSFTCSNTHARDASGQPLRQSLSATKWWTGNHTSAGWWAYTQPSYKFKNRGAPVKPRCQADEYPPAYFLTPAVNAIEHGQLIRWIPGNENGGAASVWTGFCASLDGGAGNSQTYAADNQQLGHRKGSINTNLVSGIGKAEKENEHRGADGTTTTTFAYADAKYTRAVLDMKFDWTGVEEPSEKNDWGLRSNPCWPKGIVPNDPGYVLLPDDKFYDKPPIPDDRKLYRNSAPHAMVAAAPKPSGWKPPQPNKKASKIRPKRPGPSGKNDPTQRGKTRAQTATGLNQQTQAGSGVSKRALDTIQDGLVFRDVNSTRRLTEEEMDQGIEIIDCADRLCSKERRTLDDDDEFVIIPGEPPSKTPSANIDSAPTSVPVATTLEIRVAKRGPASPDLPKATRAVG